MGGWKRSALLASLFVVGGCYEYHPVRPADAPLDARVRATVSAQQAAELAPVLRNVTPTVAGTLLERDANSILIEVPLYDATAGMSSTPLHNRVRITMDNLVSLEDRKLSKWKTAVSLAAVAAGVTGAYIAVTGAENPPEKDKTGTNNNVISIFRIPIGFE